MPGVIPVGRLSATVAGTALVQAVSCKGGIVCGLNAAVVEIDSLQDGCDSKYHALISEPQSTVSAGIGGSCRYRNIRSGLAQL